MSIEVNAKVWCDRPNCRSAAVVALTETVTMAANSWDDRDVKRDLERFGWTKDGEDDVCPLCVAEEEEKDVEQGKAGEGGEEGPGEVGPDR